MKADPFLTGGPCNAACSRPLNARRRIRIQSQLRAVATANDDDDTPPPSQARLAECPKWPAKGQDISTALL